MQPKSSHPLSLCFSLSLLLSETHPQSLTVSLTVSLSQTPTHHRPASPSLTHTHIQSKQWARDLKAERRPEVGLRWRADAAVGCGSRRRGRWQSDAATLGGDGGPCAQVEARELACGGGVTTEDDRQRWRWPVLCAGGGRALQEEAREEEDEGRRRKK